MCHPETTSAPANRKNMPPNTPPRYPWARSPPPPAGRLGPPATVVPRLLFLGGVALSAVVAWNTHEYAQESAHHDFDQLADRVSADVRHRLELPFYGLRGARAMMSSGGNVLDLPALQRYVEARDLRGEFPGVWGFGYAERVYRSELSRYLDTAHRAGDKDFQVRTSGDASDLFVIRFIEPRDINAPAIGFDIGSEASRREAAERAWHAGALAVTAPVTLVQDSEGRPGALLMVPVFASGLNEARDASDRVVGLFLAAITYDLVLGSPTNGEPPLLLLLEDVDATLDRRLVHQNHAEASTYDSQYRQAVEFDYHGRTLRLSLRSTPTFDRGRRAVAPWFILLLGTLTSFVVARGYRRQHDLRSRAEALAADMTVELDRLAMVARLTDAAVLVTDEFDRVRWANPAFSRMTGHAPETVIDRRPHELAGTAACDPEAAASIADGLANGLGFSGTLRRNGSEGRECWSELEVRPILADGGRRVGAVYIETDITERRRQQDALRASRELLDATGRMAGVGGWSLTLSDSHLEWSDHTRKIHEVPPDFAPDLATAVSFYAPEARDTISGAVQRAIETGESWDLELPLVTATGRRIWARAVGEVQYEDGRPVRLIGAFQDVSVRVLQRQRIDAERRRFALILDGTDAATWELEVPQGRLELNPRMAALIGADPEHWSNIELERLVDRMHPADRATFSTALAQHLAGHIAGVFCEFRVRHEDGTWVWVMCRGRLMTHDAGSRPDRIFGTCIDITPRKQAEIEVAQQRTLLSTTLHSIGDAVLTTDVDGRITWMNPVAEGITGWVNDDAIGRVAREVLALQSDEAGTTAHCPVEVCIREQRKVGLANETYLRSRSGRRYVVEDSASPLRDPDGTIRGVVVIFRDVTEKARLAGEMRRRASHDGLTGLLNRSEFEAIAAKSLERATTDERPGAMMFLDLDHFKVVNDACGHAAGDHLLRQIATVLSGTVRSGDTVARFGGDEFAILLDACPLARAEELANRIVDAVDAYRYNASDGRRFRVGISIGLVPVDSRWANLTQVMQAADAACYAAKSEGRGRVVVQAAMLPAGLSSQEVVKWGPRIEQALDEDLFVLHAQRIVPLDESDTSAQRFEVLLRLPDASGALASPSLFMPTAERYQLASRVDRWVLRRVIAILAAAHPGNALRASVNLSGQSVGDRAFHKFALELIENSGLPRDCLCVEITETAAVTNLADASDFIERLHAAGVEVALDDFGSGTSSFGYLKSLRVDSIKIDGQFVRGAVAGGLEAVAIRSFVEAARVLDIRIVAEQVETPEVSAMLARAGVDYVQGHLLHRPEPLDDLLDAMRSESKARSRPLRRLGAAVDA